MKEDIIAMSKKELGRLTMLHKVMNKIVTQVVAGGILKISERQVRRIIEKIRLGGDKAIQHGNRGQISPQKISQHNEGKIIALVEKKYSNFGPTLAAEKLKENEGIKISREKLRQFMISHDLWRTKPKDRGIIHQWRERRHHFGEMLQMDGSDHDWLEGRGPRIVLMGYVDDATSKFFGRFYEFEGTYPAMDSFRRYICQYGLPRSVYLDKHSTYKINRGANLDEDLKGIMPESQFGRSLNEVDVEVIYANSPQAKGRIERKFGTLQDRLVKELRLADVSTLVGANVLLETYLPEFNRHFEKKALKGGNLHRAIPSGLDLDEIFCLKEPRSIGNDYTIRWKNRILLLQQPTLAMRRQRVCVLEHFDGRLTMKLNGKNLAFKDVTGKDVKAMETINKAVEKLHRKPAPYTPPPDHPWRSFHYSKKELVYT